MRQTFIGRRLSFAFPVLAALAFAVPALSPAAAIVPFSLTNSVPANDDGFVGPVALNIDGGSINFFGQDFSSLFVNNNGNVTFQSGLSTYTPNGLATGVGRPIIAPFFGDVDTRAAGSNLTMYGDAMYNGREAFVANWVDVGYFSTHEDKLNSFQLILTDRADTGAGNFDIEFNYDQIQWETGDASGGSNGLGGVSAVAGYSNGLSGAQNVYYQLPGSLVNGALLDGGPDSLIASSLNSDVLGRYIFAVRNGEVVTPEPPPSAVPEPGAFGMIAAAMIGFLALRRRFSFAKN